MQQLEGVDHVDRRDVPLEVPFTQIHEDVVAGAGQRLELPICAPLVESDVIHLVLGHEPGEVARRVVVLIIDRRARIVGLEDADLHAGAAPPA